MTPLRPEKGDDISQYKTALWLNPSSGIPMIILDRLPNGDCFYLGPDGCTIHDRAPYECRKFDCRQAFRDSDRAGRRIAIKRGDMKKEIFARGRELIKTGEGVVQ